jgi:hypothetical protein
VILSYIYIYVCQCGKKKIKFELISLPIGAVGKGPFAECSWQLLSATLGTNFPARVFPTKNPPCRRPGREAVGKDDFKNLRVKPLLTATFFGRRPAVGSRQRLCREPRARVLGKESWPRKNFPSALCRGLLSAKTLPSV